MTSEDLKMWAAAAREAGIRSMRVETPHNGTLQFTLGDAPLPPPSSAASETSEERAARRGKTQAQHDAILFASAEGAPGDDEA